MFYIKFCFKFYSRLFRHKQHLSIQHAPYILTLLWRNNTLTPLWRNNRVVEHSDRNRMQAQNLAIVFGPTLLNSPPHMEVTSTMAIDMMYQNQIIDIMINEYHVFFWTKTAKSRRSLLVDFLWSSASSGSSKNIRKALTFIYFLIFFCTKIAVQVCC